MLFHLQFIWLYDFLSIPLYTCICTIDLQFLVHHYSLPSVDFALFVDPAHQGILETQTPQAPSANAANLTEKYYTIEGNLTRPAISIYRMYVHVLECSLTSRYNQTTKKRCTEWRYKKVGNLGNNFESLRNLSLLICPSVQWKCLENVEGDIDKAINYSFNSYNTSGNGSFCTASRY